MRTNSMSDCFEEKWRIHKEPKLEELERILNANSESYEALAKQAHEGSAKMEAFAENLERSKRTVHKGRNVGRSIAFVGSPNVAHWLNIAMEKGLHVKVTNDLENESLELSAVRKETLTRADFPSRQAWRAHCRELAKQQSKEMYK
ncbi:hypothetical protein [Acinetobacter phage vB_AbaS_TCUP2199]|nr:hypothetical protein [Acinetobacter phage vB_AbaS_TCUP2199]